MRGLPRPRHAEALSPRKPRSAKGQEALTLVSAWSRWHGECHRHKSPFDIPKPGRIPSTLVMAVETKW